MPMLPADMWGTFPYGLDGKVYQPTAISSFAQLGISTLCVFVPCFLMGVTFPLLCNAFRNDARFPAALYSWNTLGACTGVLACEFVLLAWLGHQRMYLVILIANGALGACPLPLEHEQEFPEGVAPSCGAKGLVLYL